MINPSIFLIAFAGFAALAAISDARTRRIPNVLVAAMALASAPAIALAGPGIAAAPAHAAAGALALALGWALFSLGVLGGGDGKLIAASACWLGPAAMPEFLALTALLGAALALGMIAMGARRIASSHPAAPRRNELPYALAIAPASLAAMLLRPEFLS